MAIGLDLECPPQHLARVVQLAGRSEHAAEEDERLPAVGRELDALGDVLERLAPYQLVPRLGEMQYVPQVGGVLTLSGVEVGCHAEGLDRLGVAFRGQEAFAFPEPALRLE